MEGSSIKMRANRRRLSPPMLSEGLHRGVRGINEVELVEEILIEVAWKASSILVLDIAEVYIGEAWTPINQSEGMESISSTR